MKTIVLTAKLPRTPSFLEPTSFLFRFNLGVLRAWAVDNGGLFYANIH